MAKVTTEELLGYSLSIMQGEQQVHDQGMPVFNGSGEPKMRPVWVMAFSLQKPDGERHVVTFTLNEEGRKVVVDALSGVEIVKTMPPELRL